MGYSGKRIKVKKIILQTNKETIQLIKFLHKHMSYIGAIIYEIYFYYKKVALTLRARTVGRSTLIMRMYKVRSVGIPTIAV